MNRMACVLLASVAVAIGGPAEAALTVSGTVGGAPLPGAEKDNLDWLNPLQFGPQNGSVALVSPQSGITVTLLGGSSSTANDRAGAVSGSAIAKYVPPFLSGANGFGFGAANGVTNPPAGDQALGWDQTPYLTTGSTGASPGSAVEILLPGGGHTYFGLLWGSVDTYNTLSFFRGTDLIGTVTGSTVTGSPVELPGPRPTYYRKYYINPAV